MKKCGKSRLKSVYFKCTFFYVIFFQSYFYSFGNNLDIRYLTNNDGLSNSSINCIYQDSTDILWFGTWDGLDRYNSREIKIFKPNPSSNNSISNNIIRNILEERKGILWITTDCGINRYDVECDRFRRFFCPVSNNSVFKEQSFILAKDNENTIFSSVNESGIYYFDNKKDDFVQLKIDSLSTVKTMFFDRLNHLWVQTGKNELYRVIFSKNDDLGYRVEKIEKVVGQHSVAFVYFDKSRNIIWIQKTNLEVYSLDLQDDNRLVKQAVLPEKILSITFSSGYALFGTVDGLYQWASGMEEPEKIIDNISIFSLLKGNQNIVWIGSDARGVLLLTNSEENFQTFSSDNISNFGKAPVRSFFVDRNQTLWIGTKGDGLYAIKNSGYSKSKEIESVRFTTKDGLLNNSVYALSGKENDVLWIGTEGNGLNYFDFKAKKLCQITHPKNMDLTSIYSFYIQNDTVLWAGTSGQGFYKLMIDKTTNPFQIRSYIQYVYKSGIANSLNNNIVYSILPDGDNYLWIGTRGGGLNRFNIKKETFESYRYSAENENSISNDDILCLYKNKAGILWIGTSDGLDQLVDSSDTVFKFKRFTEKDGMPNNTIHGILEDRNNNIWVSTNKGIAELDPQKKKIISYYQSDGLQNNEFSDGAFYSSLSGFFYFGGIDGYNKFDPLKKAESNSFPTLHWDALYVNNKNADINLYRHKIKGQNGLQMNADAVFFSFKFTPVDYIYGSKCEIAYQLENYNNNEWIQLGTSGTIIFSNLPAGDYALKVKCSNANKEWSNEIFTLPLRINPPWWLSIYAYIIYVFLFILAIYMLYCNSRNKMVMRHKLELKTMENQKKEEIHQAKLRFFTNIAHEFCNSLTLIYGPSEQLLKNENNQNTKKYLNIIKSNAERMQNLIQQLMEFQKAETGYLDLSIESIDIAELVKYTSDHFVDVAEQKKINFMVNIIPEISNWNTDRGAFEKILFNLLSNAFKYTPELGYVHLDVTTEENKLRLCITNSGSGIKEEDKSRVFNRFKILDHFEDQIIKGFGTRTGIGLALCKTLVDLLGGSIEIDSKVNEYTSFILDFPFIAETVKRTSALVNGKIETAQEHQPVAGNPMDSSLLPNHLQTEMKSCTILIIDDDKEIRELLADILKNKYDIMLASGGNEALKMLQKKLPTLIICDIVMPEMNGVTFVQCLKNNEMTAHIPVIFLSVESSVESRIEGIEVGVDAYVTKPFHATHLEVTIEQLLNKRQKLKHYYDSPVSAIENMDGKLVHKEDKEFIIKLTRVVSENIENERLSLDMLSKEIGASKIQLYRKLKDISGETPTEFIREIRLKRAEKLLKTTNKTVQEIMYLCGFNNKSHFYRQFTKEYNKTPKEYRTSFL